MSINNVNNLFRIGNESIEQNMNFSTDKCKLKNKHVS